ncbi:MAG: DoxX family protein [Sphingomonadales bacterium]|nr:DoxX family protein [Sphingomonadales bacterium]
MPARRFARQVLVIFYGIAGLLHLGWPQPFLSITPDWVPWPHAVIALTGVAELAGAVGLAQSRSLALRHAAGWGLALYALCVWPANFHHMMLDLAKPGHAARLLYHVPRLLAQPLLIWVAPWAAGARWRRR